MRESDFYYDSQPKRCTQYLTISVLAIFCFIVATFAFLELRNFYADEPTVARILMDSFESPKDAEFEKFQTDLLHYNTTQQQINTERQARAASGNNTTSSAQKTNSFYEEQTPVVVYSKTDVESPIARRQMAEVPPKQDTDADDPYSKAYDGDYEGSDDNDYFGQPEQSEDQSAAYNMQQQEQSRQLYYSQQPYYQQSSSSPQYYDDSREDFPGPETEQRSSEEARSSQNRDSDSYYRHPYATPPPVSLGGRGNNNRRLSAANNPDNRNMQTATKNREQQQQQQYREPYPNYTDDYDYQPNHFPAAPQASYPNRRPPLQRAQYRTPSTAVAAEETQETGPQMDLLTMFKSIKTMWDLYQSFTSSWNTIAERRNREQEAAKQKYKQLQQIRINSKKPPKFNTRKNTTTTTKRPRKQLNTIGTTTANPSTGPEMYTENEYETDNTNQKLSAAKVEPRKASKAKNEENARDKRQASNGRGESTDVGEGRYIKGDPLKGYYDFVITEGSYKFWAAFQVGTAILIIYSTFAAIYYSKVNPLVSDYDYTDYLGGARSLSGGDVDFVDDDESAGAKTETKSWQQWMPRTGHSLQFILDAIDKLPTDHSADESDKHSINKEVREVKVNATDKHKDDGRDFSADSINSKETGAGSESEYSNERESLNKMKQTYNAM